MRRGGSLGAKGGSREREECGNNDVRGTGRGTHVCIVYGEKRVAQVAAENRASLDRKMPFAPVRALRLPGARTKGRTRRERTRAHAEVRRERGRNGSEEIAAARAATVVPDWASSVGTQPVAAQFAMRIDALHGEAGQILHLHSLSGRLLRGSTRGTCSKSSPGRPRRNDGGHCGSEGDWCQGKRATRYCGVIALWKS